MNDLIVRLEELVLENAKLKVTVEDLMNKNAELERTREILANTCKCHNDFFDDLGLREHFQKYFDEKVKEEQKNGK